MRTPSDLPRNQPSPCVSPAERIRRGSAPTMTTIHAQASHMGPRETAAQLGSLPGEPAHLSPFVRCVSGCGWGRTVLGIRCGWGGFVPLRPSRTHRWVPSTVRFACHDNERWRLHRRPAAYLLSRQRPSQRGTGGRPSVEMFSAMCLVYGRVVSHRVVRVEPHVIDEGEAVFRSASHLPANRDISVDVDG